MNIDWSLTGLQGLFDTMLDLAFKATTVLVVALVAWGLAGRRRPSVGSAIGQAALLGLLLLPLSAFLFPTLPVAILKPQAVVVRPDIVIDSDGSELPVDLAIEAPPEVTIPTADFKGPEVTPEAIARPKTVPARADAERSRPTINGPRFFIGFYAIISAILLIKLAVSLRGVARFRRSVSPVLDPAWLEKRDRLAHQLGIARSVSLARSSRVSVPVVLGWLRPMILLPDSTNDDLLTHADAILLHELAHVRRGDYGWNLVLRVVSAIYWIHPLIWLLSRAIVESRERACDAYCVYRLGGASAYRSALLAMAERLTRRPIGPALGLAMARSTRLGRRVRAIDRTDGEPRCQPRWPFRVAMIALALLATGTIGSARLTRAEPKPVPIIVQSNEPKREVEPIQAPAPGKVFRLKVVSAKTGLPIAKADVRVWISLRSTDWRRTDDQGRLDITYDTGPADRSFSFDLWGDGFAMQRHQYGGDPKTPIPDEATIKLQPGESLGGIIQDEQGRPVEGAIVYLWSHNYKHQDSHELLFDLRAVTGPDGRWHTGGAPTTTGDLLGFYILHPDYLSDREYVSGRERPPITDFRAGKAVSVLKKGVPIEGRVVDAKGKPVEGATVISTDHPNSLIDHEDPYVVLTDANGRFRTWQVKPGDWHLVVLAKGHAPGAREVTVGTAIPFEEIRLDPARSFRARVVDPDGQPIEGAFVNVDSWRGYRCLGVHLYSDREGWVRWDDAPEDDFRINVQGDQHVFLTDITAKAGTDVTFQIKPALSVYGYVRDAQTKKTVDQAEVDFGAVNPETGEVATWSRSPGNGRNWFYKGYLNAQFAVQADAYKLRIRSEGYQPFVSRTFRRDERRVSNYDVSLEPARADGPAVSVLRPDGKPLAGARVYQIDLLRPRSLTDGMLGGSEPSRPIVTAEDGTFPRPESSTSQLVLIPGDDCYAYAIAKDLSASPKMQALPYGRVEGRYLVGSRPLANHPIELSGVGMLEPTWMNSISIHNNGRTDADGRFVFEKVIPMLGLRISRNDREDKQRKYVSGGEPVKVEGGKTTIVTIGGKGRAIVGKVEPPEGWDRPIDFTNEARLSLQSDRAPTPYPLELFRGKTSLDQSAWSDWRHAWPFTPEGRAYLDRRFGASVALAPDGSFRIDDVPIGDYRVEIRVNEDEIGRGKAGPFFSIGRPISIPAVADGRIDEPLDLGTFRLKARPSSKLKAGDPCPKFEVTTVDGKKLSIPGDYQGKFFLLDFGTMWDDQSRLQVVRMNEILERFGKNDRFALVSLLMAADGPESRRFVDEKGQPWPQAIVGPVSNPINEAFWIEVNQFPAAILVGPDGKVVARDLFYQKISEAIAKGLGVAEPLQSPKADLRH
jgi:beta-lactamase regulating signal transducer with metallopeptidase domain/uncharacterized GH25 family protein